MTAALADEATAALRAPAAMANFLLVPIDMGVSLFSV
jgi:hypothetical protein